MKINFNKYFGAKLIAESKDMVAVKITGDPFKDPTIPMPGGRLPVKGTPAGGTPAVPGTGTSPAGNTGQKDGDACADGGAKDGNETGGGGPAPGEK